MTDMDKSDKTMRAWKRLIQGYLEGMPGDILNQLKQHYEEHIAHIITWTEIETASKQYSLHAQGGRTILLHNSSMIYKKLSADCIEAEYKIEQAKALTVSRDRILKERAKFNID